MCLRERDKRRERSVGGVPSLTLTLFISVSCYLASLTATVLLDQAKTRSKGFHAGLVLEPSLVPPSVL